MGQLSANATVRTQEPKRDPRPVERQGLSVPRYFTARLDPSRTPYDECHWDLRSCTIANDKGEIIFEQRDVEAPVDWSQTATNIVASKYFHGRMGAPERERSVAQLVRRVVDTITGWGKAGRYFKTEPDAENFRSELAHLLLTQKVSFNSPVWFNVGVSEARGYGWHYEAETDSIRKLEPGGQVRPQCSACFIVSVKDSLESILDLAKTEGMLFKWGSGTGTNLSPLREQDAGLSGGGRASGPLSFMKGFDAFAGVIKSGGKTRRAAKMVILNADHPDIEAFIWSKAREEKKAHTLVDAGYDSSLDGEAYGSIFFQNANNSVRVTDEFMRAAVENDDWWTRSRLTEQPVKRLKARDLLRQIAQATHQCGDPGMQFDTAVNRWHTSKASGRINASNPCSEYMFLDNSACNLASLNLLKFLGPDGQFDVEAFRHAVDTVIIAQEIIVDSASYPTEKIAENSHNFRALGLGYANLGALLMSLGLPYDGDAGRDYAAAATAVMTGQAYLTSARLAEAVGPFPMYAENGDSFLEVIRMHRGALGRVNAAHVPAALYEGARQCWDEAYEAGRRSGYRNAQVTLLAPTGTIGFMMDCDTTGIEPDLALVKYKKLVGGGIIKIVNNTVPQALIRLGYSPEQVERIVSHIDSTGTIEDAPGLKPEHLPVFDCSLRPANGTRFIHHMGHVRMMAAVQP
ncbi:MAG: vitamin B12-dependent ribonucleotide reductase, partial [Acidobacteriota bacterium]